jgi:hypothetical protein
VSAPAAGRLDDSRRDPEDIGGAFAELCSRTALGQEQTSAQIDVSGVVDGIFAELRV